eukprot:197064-Hanusia_phi.AAC.2
MNLPDVFLEFTPTCWRNALTSSALWSCSWLAAPRPFARPCCDESTRWRIQRVQCVGGDGGGKGKKKERARLPRAAALDLPWSPREEGCA